VWAIAEYGFRVVIAPWKDTHGARLPGFADIFRNNCTKNAVLTIELAPDDVHAMIIAVTATPGLTATVDVPAQQLRVHTVPETVYQFEIDAAVKARFIQGLDDIGITMQHASDITAFESQHNRQCGSV
jgi:3-isopropylmalate/(R)-2-methylmalate dehydratase small subunit